tara:strand:- start:631 stop:957 length:327 start_codon:yes stop_codon:yes gene_type:complete
MTALAINFTNTIADTKQTVYTSPTTGSGTRVDSFTATNNGTVDSSYMAYIGNNVSADVPIIPFKIIVWGELDLGIGLVNQTLPPGASLKVESSSASDIYFSVSGVELT